MEMLTEYKMIEDRIFTIRGQKVMVDYDLAELYGVKTKRLNEAVKRNFDRFPADFMFKLNDNELKELVAICDRFKKLKYSSTTPNVFTEQGVAMLSSVLNSERAIAIDIEIIRTFVKLRQYALTANTKNQEIAELQKILMLHIENTDNKFAEHETTIKQIIDVLNSLIEKPKENNPIGFK